MGLVTSSSLGWIIMPNYDAYFGAFTQKWNFLVYDVILPREQYKKALPQLEQLDEEEMDLFLYKYAKLKIDVIDEQDGLEGRR